jgi:hypothetical protein
MSGPSIPALSLLLPSRFLCFVSRVFLLPRTGFAAMVVVRGQQTALQGSLLRGLPRHPRAAAGMTCWAPGPPAFLGRGVLFSNLWGHTRCRNHHLRVAYFHLAACSSDNRASRIDQLGWEDTKRTRSRF